jgi:hypothetical protein
LGGKGVGLAETGLRQVGGFWSVCHSGVLWTCFNSLTFGGTKQPHETTETDQASKTIGNQGRESMLAVAMKALRSGPRTLLGL